MKTAAPDELIARSPCRIEGAGKEPISERPIASLAEVDALSNAIPSCFRVVVLLTSWCQLRKGELCALRRRDIELLRGRILLTKTFSSFATGAQ